MPQAQISQLCWLLEEAFDQGDEHSLLANLRDVDDDLANRALTEGGRSIAEMIRHVGYFKHVYQSCAFGNGSKPENGPSRDSHGRFSLEELLAWTREGHRLLVDSVSALEDSELEQPRKVHWGDLLPTRSIVRIMIEHDLYHAGEVNHLRAVLQGNDEWGLFRGTRVDESG